MASIPDPETVAQIVLAHFNMAGAAHWQAAAPVQVRQMPWSTLYFLTLDGPGGLRRVVAKIVHFPDQTAPEISWQNDELRVRGQREYESMRRVYDHFAALHDPALQALRPEAYLPAMNLVLMDYAAGTPLYNACATPGRLLTPARRRASQTLMAGAGRWLRHLHALPVKNPPAERCFGPAEARRDLLAEVERLRARGVRLEGARWDRALAALGRVDSGERVWTHGDFHLRNVLVLPGDHLLGFDTALERVDSPYFDLGKLAADLKTRRARILRFGLLPDGRTVARLTQAFLAAYLAGKPLDERCLALYEGRFLFQKWNESLDALDDAFYGPRRAPGTVLRRVVIDPTFHRLAAQWMDAAQR